MHPRTVAKHIALIRTSRVALRATGFAGFALDVRINAPFAAYVPTMSDLAKYAGSRREFGARDAGTTLNGDHPMSTKSTIRYHRGEDGEPSWHLYEEAFEKDDMVYLELEGIQADVVMNRQRMGQAWHGAASPA